MTYSTSNPPYLLSQGLNGSRKFWWYVDTDAAGDVDADGYITNAESLGMAAGDIVLSIDTDASPIAAQIHIVSVINSDGSADLSAGTAITATNAD